MRRAQKRAVVVGAGVAGLVAAARLAREGYATTLLEKGAAAGGRAGRFERDGFRFDLGPTLLFMPDVFRAAFAACGASFDREVPMTRLAINYRLNFADGRALELSPELPPTLAALDAYAPGAGAALLRYLAGSARAYELSREHFVGKRIRSLWEFLTPRRLGALVGSGAFRSLHATATRAFGAPDLVAALTFQTMYLGMSPFASPELYRLLLFTELGEGIFYPQGGIYALVVALERLARRCGVEIHYNRAVDGVERRGRSVAAVTANGARYPCDVALLTADLPYAYRHILGERHRSANMRLTPSALLLYLALDERYPDLAHHEFLMPRELRQTCRDIFERGTFPDDPAIYLAAPSGSDASCAPPGKEALYVLVPVPNLRGGIDWTSRRPELIARTLERIERRRLPGLRARIRWLEARTPLDFAGTLNLHDGSAFGLAHDLLQIGPLRPDTRHARLKNVYFAGASTRPATGLPLVTLSAMQTVERICEEIPA